MADEQPPKWSARWFMSAFTCGDSFLWDGARDDRAAVDQRAELWGAVADVAFTEDMAMSLSLLWPSPLIVLEIASYLLHLFAASHIPLPHIVRVQTLDSTHLEMHWKGVDSAFIDVRYDGRIVLHLAHTIRGPDERLETGYSARTTPELIQRLLAIPGLANK
jgi:hypothetical protein